MDARRAARSQRQDWGGASGQMLGGDGSSRPPSLKAQWCLHVTRTARRVPHRNSVGVVMRPRVLCSWQHKCHFHSRKYHPCEHSRADTVTHTCSKVVQHPDAERPQTTWSTWSDRVASQHMRQGTGLTIRSVDCSRRRRSASGCCDPTAQCGSWCTQQVFFRRAAVVVARRYRDGMQLQLQRDRLHD